MKALNIVKKHTLGLLFCLVVLGTISTIIFAYFLNNMKNIMVYCKNDNSIIFSSENAFSKQHEFCPDCGERIEDIGIVSTESLEMKNQQTDVKSWLEEKEFSSFTVYQNRLQQLRIGGFIIAGLTFYMSIFLIFLGIAKSCQEPWFDGAAH